MPRGNTSHTLTLEDPARTFHAYPNGHAKFLTPAARLKLAELRRSAGMWSSDPQHTDHPERLPPVTIRTYLNKITRSPELSDTTAAGMGTHRIDLQSWEVCFLLPS